MRISGIAAALALLGCAAAPDHRSEPVKKRRIDIELLALDLASCGRCTRTAANLDAALEEAAGVLREADAEVRVRKTVVRTEAEAERLRFVSSPTIRVDGRDIALELRESSCADCGSLCGCDGAVDCRVWVWRGQEHTEAPEAMILDAVVRAAREPAALDAAAGGSYRMPDNLRRFFRGARRAGAPAASCGSPAGGAGACCPGGRS